MEKIPAMRHGQRHPHLTTFDVLLVSPVEHLGGIIVNGLGSQDVDPGAGNAAPIGGLTNKFFIRIAKAYNPKRVPIPYVSRPIFRRPANTMFTPSGAATRPVRKMSP